MDGVSAIGRRGATCSVFGMIFEINAGKAVTGFNAIQHGIRVPSGLCVEPKSKEKKT